MTASTVQWKLNYHSNPFSTRESCAAKNNGSRYMGPS